MLRLMKSNVPLLNILHRNLQKTHSYISELILTTFNPFCIKYKKLNVKNLCLGG